MRGVNRNLLDLVLGASLLGLSACIGVSTDKEVTPETASEEDAATDGTGAYDAMVAEVEDCAGVFTACSADAEDYEAAADTCAAELEACMDKPSDASEQLAEAVDACVQARKDCDAAAASDEDKADCQAQMRLCVAGADEQPAPAPTAMCDEALTACAAEAMDDADAQLACEAAYALCEQDAGPTDAEREAPALTCKEERKACEMAAEAAKDSCRDDFESCEAPEAMATEEEAMSAAEDDCKAVRAACESEAMGDKQAIAACRASFQMCMAGPRMVAAPCDLERSACVTAAMEDEDALSACEAAYDGCTTEMPAAVMPLVPMCQAERDACMIAAEQAKVACREGFASCTSETPAAAMPGRKMPACVDELRACVEDEMEDGAACVQDARTCLMAEMMAAP